MDFRGLYRLPDVVKYQLYMKKISFLAVQVVLSILAIAYIINKTKIQTINDYSTTPDIPNRNSGTEAENYAFTTTTVTSSTPATVFTAPPEPTSAVMPSTTTTATPRKVSLPVPFYWEIPDGVWVPPWSGACEEASIVAAEGYYLGRPKEIVPKAQAKTDIFPLFGIENKLFGYNIDTSGIEITRLINHYASFDAKLVDNPTLEQIKTELDAGRPVISLHYGYNLDNPRHRFRAGGSSYHVMTIVGYDDNTGEFLVNDSELSDGIDFRYKYGIILSTLHDFDHTDKKADGPARAVFTSPKQIWKNLETGDIYLIRDGQKHLIANLEVMRFHRWSTTLIQAVSAERLAAIPDGEAITK